MNTGGGAKPTTVKPSQVAAQMVLPSSIITSLEERSQKGHPGGCHQDLGEISEVGPQWREHRVRPGKAKVHRTLSQAEAGSRESKSGTYTCLKIPCRRM